MTTDLTAQDIDELRRLEKAIPGPKWCVNYGTINSHPHIEVELACINGLPAWFTLAEINVPDEQEQGMSDGAIGDGTTTAEFVAATRNALPRLLAMVERLQLDLDVSMTSNASMTTELLELRAVNDQMAGHISDRDTELDTLRRQIAEKDAEIERLKQETENYRNRLRVATGIEEL